MRMAAWVGSIAVHVVVAAVLMRCEAPGIERRVEEGVAIEVGVERVAAVKPEPDEKKQMAPGAASSAPKAHAPVRRQRAAVRGAGVVIEEEDRTRIGRGHGRGFGSGSGSGSGSGIGTGIGSGTGIGIGSGQGSGSEVPPPRRIVSKARPARLIWPKRQRDERPGEVFVAKVVVDDEGYVAGVRLLASPAGRRADDAESAVWRFRYAPALDDEGRPVRSRVVQRFMVE